MFKTILATLAAAVIAPVAFVVLVNLLYAAPLLTLAAVAVTFSFAGSVALAARTGN